jgi:hypothetical protein
VRRGGRRMRRAPGVANVVFGALDTSLLTMLKDGD